MNRSTPDLPVHHQLPEFTQTHVHRVGDSIQPSHPLSSPSPPAPTPSQHQSLFQWVNSLHQVAKVLEFQPQHQSFQWTLRTDLLQNELVGSPWNPRDSQGSSPTLQFKSISSSVAPMEPIKSSLEFLEKLSREKWLYQSSLQSAQSSHFQEGDMPAAYHSMKPSKTWCFWGNCPGKLLLVVGTAGRNHRLCRGAQRDKHTRIRKRSLFLLQYLHASTPKSTLH